MIEIIKPTSQEHWLELRMNDLTSTDISALFGISPYLTAYELWHRKKDRIHVEFEENQRMKWGTRLQDAIAAGIAEEKGWTVKRMDEYVRRSTSRLGSSFDFSIEMYGQEDSIGHECEDPRGILEIKNVDSLQFKREWIEDETGLQAPYHIEIQVQHQLLVSGREFAYIGALVGGNDLKLIKRTRDEKVLNIIQAKAKEFWSSIDSNTPPSPNFDTDAQFITSLCQMSEPGKVIDVTQDSRTLELAIQYISSKEIIKTNTEKCESIKAEILTRIGDAEKCLAPTFSISAGTVGPTWIEAYERKGYRNFRITPKKEK